MARRTMAGFLHRQPASVGDAALAYLMCAAWSTCLWTIAFIGIVLTMSASLLYIIDAPWRGALPDEPLWAWTAIAFVFTWIAYWRGWLIVLLMLPEGFVDVARSPERLLLLASTLCAILSMTAFVRAYRRKLMSISALVAIAGSAACIGVAMTFPLTICGMFTDFGRAELWTLCGAIGVLAASPATSVPLDIFYARHR
jgi:hypothetical protein